MLTNVPNSGGTPVGPAPTTVRHAVARIQAEYLEMPGLKLTTEQVARLCALDTTVCSAVLAALVDCGFLVRPRDTFARP